MPTVSNRGRLFRGSAFGCEPARRPMKRPNYLTVHFTA